MTGSRLDHLDRMTDSTGLIQHAIYSIPRRESGYTTDDNARALRLCVRLWSQHPEDRMLGRVTTYLSFLEHARGVGPRVPQFPELSTADWLDAEGTRRLPRSGGPRAGRSARQQSARRIPRSGPRVDRRGFARAGRPAKPAGASVRDPGVGTSSECGGEETSNRWSVAWSAAQRLVECYRPQRSGRIGRGSSRA